MTTPELTQRLRENAWIGDAVLELGAQVADAGARITERLGGAQP